MEPSSIRSVKSPNPKRSGLPAYKHQIDFYWDTEDAVSRYLNIANPKWRDGSKVDQPDVLLLQQVRQKVAAHKAIMITNSYFTSGELLTNITRYQDDFWRDLLIFCSSELHFSP